MNNNSLIGTYKLISWEIRHESGQVNYPLGPDAQGVINYSQNGYVFVHIMAQGRKMHSAGDLFGGEISELKNSATTHISYCGKYDVQGNQVVHYVTISSFPNWVNSEQRRNWEFKDGRLLLSAHGLQVGSEKVEASLIWERVTTQNDI